MAATPVSVSAPPKRPNILKVRMGDRLNFRIDIADDIKGFPFPPMLIQPLVEKAIKHGLEVLELIKEQKPDIVFLDIRMPGLSGIEVSKKVAGSCWIVFITAYDQYAIEAFENEAIDYMLKPIKADRL